MRKVSVQSSCFRQKSICPHPPEVEKIQMNAMRDAQLKVRIKLNYLSNIGDCIWRVDGADNAIGVEIESDVAFDSDKKARAHFREFAKINKLKNWKFVR